MEEEEIMNESVGYAMEANATLYGDTPSTDHTDIIENIFVDGAHWALNHQWIDIKVAIPKIEDKNSEMVLCHIKNGNYYYVLCLYSYEGSLIWSDSDEYPSDFAELEDVDYWMPIPVLLNK